MTTGPPPGPRAYEEGVYAPGSPRAQLPVRLLQRATVRQPARMLERAGVRPDARVLDAGAGRGRLVAELRRRGYAATGIEPSARGAAAARAAGQPVEQHAIADYDDEELDAVVLWHVLEHLEDPREAIGRAWTWLRRGGVMIAAVPNVASLQAKVGSEKWHHWDAPRHRVHLTPTGVDALLAAAGFESVRVHHHIWEHNPAGMWMALLSRAGLAPSFPFHLLKRNVQARPRDLGILALGLPLVPLAVALEASAGALERGGTIAVVARRA